MTSTAVTLVTGRTEVTSRPVPTVGHELARCEIRRGDEPVGVIVYVRRRHRRGGSTYGWRSATAAPSSRLHTKPDAVALLLDDPATVVSVLREGGA